MSKIITPKSKVEVELRDEITGQDYEDIQAPITNVKLMVDAGGSSKGEINVGEAHRRSMEIAIERVVVSVGGSDKDILKKVLGFSKTDYLFIRKEVDKVVSGENFTKD